MGARESWPRHDESHRVLQLIPKAVRTTRLVEGGPRPDATRQGLVEKPTIDQKIERPIGGLHLDGAKEALPASAHDVETGFGILFAVFLHQLARGRAIGRLSKHEPNVDARSGCKDDRREQDGASVEPASLAFGERSAQGEARRT